MLWKAQRAGELVVTGPYARVRHPQYAGFLLVMAGFLLQWPTITTVVMFPILVVVYRRLAVGEEREVRGDFTETWDAYAALTPRFIPRSRSAGQRVPGAPAARIGDAAPPVAPTPADRRPARSSAP